MVQHDSLVLPSLLFLLNLFQTYFVILVSIRLFSSCCIEAILHVAPVRPNIVSVGIIVRETIFRQSDIVKFLSGCHTQWYILLWRAHICNWGE